MYNASVEYLKQSLDDASLIIEKQLNRLPDEDYDLTENEEDFIDIETLDEIEVEIRTAMGTLIEVLYHAGSLREKMRAYRKKQCQK